MSGTRVRVWVEEVDPPTVLRFTWEIPDDYGLADQDAQDLIRAALAENDAVACVTRDGDGLLVEFDPDQITRPELAALLRGALQPVKHRAASAEFRRRVWAEELSATELRITWEASAGFDDSSDRHQRRRVAAWLTVCPGVRSVAPDDEGVVLRYDPKTLDRGTLGDEIRDALDETMSLRERSDELLKRATTYGNLARKLALDDRISPLPGAAKQAVSARAAGSGGRNVAARTALRFVPGGALIARAQTMVPLLTELATWSREADPEIVETHLSSVGLDRKTLRRDAITAHEIRHYARDSAAETAAAIGEKATEGARQALAAGRDVLASMREAYSVAREASGDQTQVERGDDSASSQADSSPTDPE